MRGRHLQRPLGCFGINSASAHAQSLVGWWAAYQGLMVNMLRPPVIAPQLVLSGSSPGPYLGSALGACPRTDFVSGKTVIDAGLPGALDGLAEFTVAYWFYPLVGTNHAHWGQGDPSTSTFCYSSGGTVGTYLRGIGGGDNRGWFVDRAVLNVWQHVAWRLTWAPVSGDLSVFWNGQKQNAGVGNGTITAAANAGLYIGGFPAGTGGESGAASALFADFRVYRRALSDAEILSLWDAATRWDLYKRFTLTLPSSYFQAPPKAMAFAPRRRDRRVG